MAKETAPRTPETERDQYCRKGEHLPDFHSDIETDDVRYKPVLGQVELLKLGSQSEAVEQAEDQHRELGVGLKTQKSFEPVHIVEGFVDHRETDDRIDQVRVRVDAPQNTRQQRDTVADGEQADVCHDVLEPVKKKDDTYQERQVVVSGEHVLGAQIDEGRNGSALVGLHERGVALGDVMCEGGGR